VKLVVQLKELQEMYKTEKKELERKMTELDSEKF
jgi:hypothetical protein